MHLHDALDRFTRLEDGRGIAHTQYFLGRIKHEQAQDAQAAELFNKSKRIFEAENDLLGMAKNLNLLAICEIRKSRDFQTARDYLERSMTLQRKRPLSSTYVETLRNLAWVQSCLDAYGDAERDLGEALDVSRQLNDIGEYAAVLYDRVVLCKMRNQLDQALAFGYECLAIFRKLGSLRWEALIKTQLGLLHQAKQEPVRGLALLTEGLQLFCDLRDAYEQAYSYYYLHKLYGEMGETEQSYAAKQQARRLNLELNDPQLSERLR